MTQERRKRKDRQAKRKQAWSTHFSFRRDNKEFVLTLYQFPCYFFVLTFTTPLLFVVNPLLFFHCSSKAPDEKTVMFPYSCWNRSRFFILKLSPSSSWLVCGFKDLICINYQFPLVIATWSLAEHWLQQPGKPLLASTHLCHRDQWFTFLASTVSYNFWVI